MSIASFTALRSNMSAPSTACSSSGACGGSLPASIADSSSDETWRRVTLVRDRSEERVVWNWDIFLVQRGLATCSLPAVPVVPRSMCVGEAQNYQPFRCLKIGVSTTDQQVMNNVFVNKRS